MQKQPPEDNEIFKSELGTYWLGEDGVLYSVSTTTKRTIENIKENIALVKRITNNKKVCLIVHVAPSPVPDKQTRDYVAKALPDVYKAMAMVSKGGLGKMIMNILFKLRPPSIPMKTFSDEIEAKEWIKQYL